MRALGTRRSSSTNPREKPTSTRTPPRAEDCLAAFACADDVEDEEDAEVDGSETAFTADDGFGFVFVVVVVVVVVVAPAANPRDHVKADVARTLGKTRDSYPLFAIDTADDVVVVDAARAHPPPPPPLPIDATAPRPRFAAFLPHRLNIADVSRAYSSSSQDRSIDVVVRVVVVRFDARALDVRTDERTDGRNPDPNERSRRVARTRRRAMSLARVPCPAPGMRVHGPNTYLNPKPSIYIHLKTRLVAPVVLNRDDRSAAHARAPPPVDPGADSRIHPSSRVVPRRPSPSPSRSTRPAGVAPIDVEFEFE